MELRIGPPLPTTIARALVAQGLTDVAEHILDKLQPCNALRLNHRFWLGYACMYTSSESPSNRPQLTQRFRHQYDVVHLNRNPEVADQASARPYSSRQGMSPLSRRLNTTGASSSTFRCVCPSWSNSTNGARPQSESLCARALHLAVRWLRDFCGHRLHINSRQDPGKQGRLANRLIVPKSDAELNMRMAKGNRAAQGTGQSEGAPKGPVGVSACGPEASDCHTSGAGFARQASTTPLASAASWRPQCSKMSELSLWLRVRHETSSTTGTPCRVATSCTKGQAGPSKLEATCNPLCVLRKPRLHDAPKLHQVDLVTFLCPTLVPMYPFSMPLASTWHLSAKTLPSMRKTRTSTSFRNMKEDVFCGSPPTRALHDQAQSQPKRCERPAPAKA